MPASDVREITLWSVGRPTPVSGANQVTFAFSDGRLASLKQVGPAGHFLLEAWAQGDPADRKRTPAVDASFDVTPQRAQINRLAISDRPGGSAVAHVSGPAIRCLVGDLDSAQARSGVGCVEFRLASGPVVQFGWSETEIGGGADVIYVRGWPGEPQLDDEHLRYEYLGIHLTLRGMGAAIRSARAEVDRG